MPLWSQVIMFICKYMSVLKELTLMEGIAADCVNGGEKPRRRLAPRVNAGADLYSAITRSLIQIGSNAVVNTFPIHPAVSPQKEITHCIFFALGFLRD